ncbi:MAG: ferrochelatase [Lactobacillus sp.]|jgi:ferrochelatase|nr:ferrochelatase [Lactobacillus sp.]
MRGVLLVNLGTPTAPTATAVRRFLNAFLSDRRVIQMSPLFWQPLLKGCILPFRGPHSAKMYRQVWTPQGSPILTITQAQTAKLQALRPDCRVRYAMSYSAPTIETALADMAVAGVTALTIIPLYPQYSTTTTASIHDAVHRYYCRQVNSPSLHLLSAWWQTPAYLEALSTNIRRQLTGQTYDYVLFSYHGIPQSYHDQGDPYRAQCLATTAAVCDRLHLTVAHSVSFQSKFGPAQWITPATKDVLRDLAAAGKRRVAVVTPSFVADCLETLYEIGIENTAAFQADGGEALLRLAPLNADDAFIEALATLI